ncbi:hypothetical protein Acr_09g0006490 [Actinidia rufa]|uniref:Uncharacterized protein n=1 Tax=Actinidia rufa TaxID=165716 RepID=A0A7J0F6G9_9ERIC|nr:hypothetical protein Acr_09g0006490 [Actinidia rufa]
MRSYSLGYKARDSEDSTNNILEINLAQLQQIREQLKTAKDEATQSWLDSRTLVDELENVKSGLAATKNQISMSNIVIPELESQLEMTDKSTRSKKEEELKLRTKINEFNQAVDQTSADIEQLKMEKDEELRTRSELKQVLRLQRQTLRALQLTIRATRLESEAFGSSAWDALHYINHSETDNTTVKLTHEEYYALTRRAKEETSLADWRVSVSKEQRLVAEASRDSALRRLKELQIDNKLRKRKTKEKVDTNITQDAEQDSKLGVGAQAKLTAESSQGKLQQQMRKSRSNSKKIVKKKKPSIFVRISTYLVGKITRLFG